MPRLYGHVSRVAPRGGAGLQGLRRAKRPSRLQPLRSLGQPIETGRKDGTTNWPLSPAAVAVWKPQWLKPVSLNPSRRPEGLLHPLAVRPSALLPRPQRAHAQKLRCFPQFLFDTQKLIVFGDSVRTRGRAGFDLTCSRSYRQVCDKRVFGFPGPVRDDGGVAVAARNIDGLERLTHCADLIDLDENGVGYALLDASAEALGVGDEQVIAHELDLITQFFGQGPPAVPVVLGQTIFDGDDRVLPYPVTPEADHVLR